MNLWPVGWTLFSRSALIWKFKCSTGQRFICTDVTSYEIHTLMKQIDVNLKIFQLICCILLQTQWLRWEQIASRMPDLFPGWTNFYLETAGDVQQDRGYECSRCLSAIDFLKVEKPNEEIPKQSN